MAFITTGSGHDIIRVDGNTITSFTENNGDVLDLRQALAGTSWNHAMST